MNNSEETKKIPNFHFNKKERLNIRSHKKIAKMHLSEVLKKMCCFPQRSIDTWKGLKCKQGLLRWFSQVEEIMKRIRRSEVQDKRRKKIDGGGEKGMVSRK